MNLTLAWSTPTMLLYIVMGLIGALCIKYNSDSLKYKKLSRKCISAPYIFLFFTWEAFAVFRLVRYPIGGADAAAYARYFVNCFHPVGDWETNHIAIMYRWLNQCVRIFTDDYHVMFFLIYAIIVASYIAFIEEFRISEMSCIPFVILVYIYIRGFNTIRTNLGVACVLFSLIAMHRKRNKIAFVFAIISALFQVASLLYAAVVLFYYLNKEKNVRIRSCVIGLFFASFAARLGQYIVLNYQLPFLENGAYRWYASTSSGQSFFGNYWKISFPQIVMGGVYFALYKRLQIAKEGMKPCDRDKVQFVEWVIIFDVLTIPVTFVLGIWRGYEYLYIARLMMWAYLIPIIMRCFTKQSRKYIHIGLFIMFVGWMIFRQYNTWEDSGLMPYIFEPFYELIS